MLHRRITLVSSLMLGMTLLTAQPILAEEPPVNQPVTSQVQSTSQLALDQIRQGNYASLAGRWANAQGTAFLISPDGKIYMSEKLLEVHIELAGLSATSTDKQLSILTKVMPDNQVIGSLVVAPAGQAFLDMEDLDRTDLTDQTRDRLFLGPTARTVPYSQLVLYRESFDLVYDGKTLDQLLDEARGTANQVGMAEEQADAAGSSTPSSSEPVIASSPGVSVEGPLASSASTETTQDGQEAGKEGEQLQEASSSSATGVTDQVPASQPVATEEPATARGQTVTESNSALSPSSSGAQPSSSQSSTSPSAQPSQLVSEQPSGSGQQSTGATASSAQSSKAPATSPSSAKTVKSPAPKTSNSAPVSGQSSTKASPLPAATKGVSQSSARPQAKGTNSGKKVLPKTGESNHRSALGLGLGLFGIGLVGPVLVFLGMGRRRQG